MRPVSRVVAVAAFALASLLSSCSALPRAMGDLEESVTQELEKNDQPPQGVLGLARELDSLEYSIDKYGSVVPKQADVWGQARLTMHRQEYELEMRAELNKFAESLQGSLYRSDQAFLASAMSLQAAVASRRGKDSSTQVNTQVVDAKDPPGVTGDETKVINRAKPLESKQFGFTAEKLSLEPTLRLSQKDRYLRHLHELRRINEGDDNTDSPGYALNLVRVPVSVLTGSCTKSGWGAECTVTASLQLNDDLLPTTFRNLVIKDIVDLLTIPLTRVMDDKKALGDLLAQLPKYHNELVKVQQSLSVTAGKARSWAKEGVLPKEEVQSLLRNNYSTLLPQTMQAREREQAMQAREREADEANQAASQANAKILGEMKRTIGSIAPTSRRRVASLPLPPSQLVGVLGEEQLTIILLNIYKQFQDHLTAKGQPYHLDVHNALEEELKGAYEVLTELEARPLWQVGGPALAKAIRKMDQEAIEALRGDFLTALTNLRPNNAKAAPKDRIEHGITASLAWAILVESAMLNERLLEDMKATQAAKGCPCPPEGGMPFYLPDPSPEARKLFNDYVRCRWPIYVFAIDPTTEDQNIADTFSQRREMQLALSLAFTSGRIGARTMTRYMRRIEVDMQTIALNRTVVGFSHGPDTFGWRFYPRFQTPPIPSNLETFFCDFLWGGKSLDCDLCHRRLENGPRECVALVVMPSFVPHINLDFHANWFKLAHPTCKALTNTQAMRLSHKVQTLRDCAGDACDEGRYRPGDKGLLLNRVEQLSARLPLQHQLVNIPYENTHGGFEMFNTGTSDLAPELIGWYGGAGIGIDPKEEYSSVFLVGDHFSVHQTRVVVGGVALNATLPDNRVLDNKPAEAKNLQVELLSRQIMRIIIPRAALPKSGSVDVHVGTPYGVSNHLSIPVVGVTPPAPPAGYALADAVVKAKYLFHSPAPGVFCPMLIDPPEGKFRINWNAPTGHTLSAAEAVFSIMVDKSEVRIRIPVTAHDGYFEVANTDKSKAMTAFANMLLGAIGDLRRYSPEKLPPTPLEGTVTIYPVSPTAPAPPLVVPGIPPAGNPNNAPGVPLPNITTPPINGGANPKHWLPVAPPTANGAQRPQEGLASNKQPAGMLPPPKQHADGGAPQDQQVNPGNKPAVNATAAPQLIVPSVVIHQGTVPMHDVKPVVATGKIKVELEHVQPGHPK